MDQAGEYRDALRLSGEGEHEKAVDQLTRLAGVGYVPAFSALGTYCVSDPDACRRLLEAGARRGDVDAQCLLADHLMKRSSGPADDAAARRWLAPAADAGIPAAQVMLGWLHETGRGGPQSFVEAARWYALAAEAGQARAMHRLGIMHGLGLGVPKSLTVSFFWLSLATAGGESEAFAARDRLLETLPPRTINIVLHHLASWQPRRT